MPWMLKKIWIKKKKDNTWKKKTPTKQNPISWLYLWQKGLSRVDVSTAKLKESLSCIFLESVLGRITLCLPFAKPPFLAVRQWPFLAPSPSYGFVPKVEGTTGSQGHFSPFHITASLVLGDKSGAVRKRHKPKCSCSF